MNKTIGTLVAAVTALTMSCGAFAQGNNTLARPSVVSPVAVTGGYGTPGNSTSESGQAATSSSSGQQSGGNASTPAPTVWKSNNSLARPSVVSPAAAQ
jgi:hypothetical protein|nr:hypothetical protein [Caballeronia sp. dw_276]